MTRRLVCFVVLLSVIGVANTFAQSSMGTVVGTVTDSSGAVIPGASVTLTSLRYRDRRHARQLATAATSPSSTSAPATMRSPSNSRGSRPPRCRPSPSASTKRWRATCRCRSARPPKPSRSRPQSELLQTSSVGPRSRHRAEGDPRAADSGRQLHAAAAAVARREPDLHRAGTRRERRLGTGARHRRQLGDAGIDVRQRVDPWASRTARRSITWTAIVNTSVRAGTYVALPDIDSLQEFKVESQSDKAEFGGVTGGVVNMTSKSGTNRYRRLGLRRVPQREVRGAQSVPRCAGQPSPPAFRQSQFGDQPRRPAAEEQDVLLRFVRRLALPRSSRHAPHRARGPRARRRLLADVPSPHHLQPLHHAHRERPAGARSVPGQHHSREPDLADDAGVPQGLHAEAERCRATSSTTSGSSASRRATRTRSRSASIITSRRATTCSSAGPSGASTTAFRSATSGSGRPDSINRNFGGGWFHAFSPNMMLEVRGGVATQPTEDAPFEHELGLGPAGRPAAAGPLRRLHRRAD